MPVRAWGRPLHRAGGGGAKGDFEVDPTEEALAGALIRIPRERFNTEVAKTCRAYEQYLAEYGSLGEAIRTASDATQ
jgi:hypothetical protein